MKNNSSPLREAIQLDKLIHALTVEERYSVIGNDIPTVDPNGRKRYAAIKSRASDAKLTEKCAAKGMTDRHFAAAFYDGSDEHLNETLYAYIEGQDWFVFFRNAVEQYFADASRYDAERIQTYDVPHSIQFLILS